MATDSLVLQTIVKQMQDLINALALYVEEILHRVNIILIPLKFEAIVSISQHFEHHLALLLRLEHVSVQEIVNLLVVKLKERNINSQAAITCAL